MVYIRAVLYSLICWPLLTAQAQSNPYGIEERQTNSSLLIDLASGPPPALLSASGLFTDMATQSPAPGLIPYSVNAELWSDGAYKTRLMALPGTTQIEFSEAGFWQFPANTVLVKNFYLAFEKGNEASRQIVETRFLVKDGDSDEWQGFSYMWNAEGTEAELLDDSVNLNFFIADSEAPDGFVEQPYFYPGPKDCDLCHTADAGRVLGVRTAQLNGLHDYGEAVDNQLRTLNHIGLFSEDIGEEYGDLPRWANPADPELPLEERARAYLATNCAHCHRPDVSIRTTMDLRFSTPLAQTNTVDLPPLSGSLDAEDALIVSPGDPGNSTLLLRLLSFNSNRMPPIATSVLDEEGVALLDAWIRSLAPVTNVAETATDPTAFGLSQNFPNPFNPATTIAFQLDRGSPVELAVYDLLGQKIRHLVDAELAAGAHTAVWDGRNDAGTTVASGIYLYRLEAGDRHLSRRLVLAR